MAGAQAPANVIMVIVPKQFILTEWEVAVLCHALGDATGQGPDPKTPKADMTPLATTTAEDLYKQFVTS